MAKAKDGTDRGRPLKYKTAKSLANAIAEYFAIQDSHVEHRTVIKKDKDGSEYLFEIDVPTAKPYMIAGLARCLGFCDVKSLHDYEKRGEFFHVIKEARLTIEEQDEERLKQGDGGAGLIFISKNRHGWADKQQIDQTTTERKVYDVSKIVEKRAQEIIEQADSKAG